MLVLSADLIYTLVNIIILVVLLRIFLWKPVLGILEKRRQTIQDDLDQAARTNREAQAAKAEYASALAGARRESAALVEQAKARADQQAEAILTQAGAEADAIREKAQADAQAQKEQLLTEARDELADLAILAAAHLMGGAVDEETDRRILDDWLTQMGGPS